jgi:hypothetical protein
MERVRIKYYGLFWMTRPTYVVLQSIALFLCVALVVVGLLGVIWARNVLQHLPAPGDDADLLRQALVLLFWIGLLVLLAEGIETYVVLRKFARAEAEQQSKLAALDLGGPAPTTPHATGVQPAPHEQPNTNIQS